jgi:hypothetical protein
MVSNRAWGRRRLSHVWVFVCPRGCGVGPNSRQDLRNHLVKIHAVPEPEARRVAADANRAPLSRPMLAGGAA